MKTIKKILLPIIFIYLPLWFYDQLSSVIISKQTFAGESGFLAAILYPILMKGFFKELLILLLCGFFLYLKRDNIKLGPYLKEKKTWFIIIAFSFIVGLIPSLLHFFTSDSPQITPGGFLGLPIPGAGMLPMMFFLCFGMIKTFKEKFSELKVYGLTFIGFVSLKLIMMIDFNLLPYLFPPTNLGFDIPLFSFESLFNRYDFIPSLVIIGISFLYYRLGLVSALAFNFISMTIATLMSMSFGLRSQYDLMFFLFYGFIVLGAYKYLPREN